jgi:hypothetical protein
MYSTVSNYNIPLGSSVVVLCANGWPPRANAAAEGTVHRRQAMGVGQLCKSKEV